MHGLYSFFFLYFKLSVFSNDVILTLLFLKDDVSIFNSLFEFKVIEGILQEDNADELQDDNVDELQDDNVEELQDDNADELQDDNADELQDEFELQLPN
jgi:hypothetical protein